MNKPAKTVPLTDAEVLALRLKARASDGWRMPVTDTRALLDEVIKARGLTMPASDAEQRCRHLAVREQRDLEGKHQRRCDDCGADLPSASDAINALGNSPL